MELNLSGKVAVVTGASRGIGAAIARNLAGEGVRLVLAARSRADLEKLVASLPTECLVQAVDLRDPQVPAALISAAIGQFGRLDVLVNNAGPPSAVIFWLCRTRTGRMVSPLSFLAPCAAAAQPGLLWLPAAA